MALVQILPVVCLLIMIGVVLLVTFTDLLKSKGFWIFWAVYAAVYFVFSIYAVAEDGMIMFWTNHTTNWVGNQVWIDLIFAVAIGWILVLPEARARGMNVTIWMVFILATATIGFGAMIARLLYLRTQDAA